jgi:hypothetical protein
MFFPKSEIFEGGWELRDRVVEIFTERKVGERCRREVYSTVEHSVKGECSDVKGEAQPLSVIITHNQVSKRRWKGVEKQRIIKV